MREATAGVHGESVWDSAWYGLGALIKSSPVVQWWRRFGEGNGARLAGALETIEEVGFKKWLLHLVIGEGGVGAARVNVAAVANTAAAMSNRAAMGMLMCHVMVTAGQLVGAKYFMTEKSGGGREHPDDYAMLLNAAMAPLFLLSAVSEAGSVSAAISAFHHVFEGLAAWQRWGVCATLPAAVCISWAQVGFPKP